MRIGAYFGTGDANRMNIQTPYGIGTKLRKSAVCEAATVLNLYACLREFE